MIFDLPIVTFSVLLTVDVEVVCKIELVCCCFCCEGVRGCDLDCFAWNNFWNQSVFLAANGFIGVLKGSGAFCCDLISDRLSSRSYSSALGIWIRIGLCMICFSSKHSKLTIVDNWSNRWITNSSKPGSSTWNTIDCVRSIGVIVWFFSGCVAVLLDSGQLSTFKSHSFPTEDFSSYVSCASVFLIGDCWMNSCCVVFFELFDRCL